nr:Gag-pre-integrase domain, Gag-polypeptide of LTR copia-type [Tanacetum cinerariifolium]
MAGDDVNKNQTGDSGKKTHNEGDMIDHNSPFYLHASDYTKQIKNYNDWEKETMSFMFAKNKTGFIDGSIKKPKTKSDKYLPWMQTTELKGKERTYEFLMGLDDQFSVIKTQILAMKLTPDLSAAYHLVAKDEQQRTIASSKGPVREVAAFHTSFQGRREQTRNQQEKGWTKNKGGFQEDKTEKYSECGREGHNKSGCFKIIGYPKWWKGKGKEDKSKPKATMVEMKPCPIMGMTEEQYAMFLKLFGENREGPVIANMADFFVLQDLKARNLIGAGDYRGGLYWMGGIKEKRKAMTVTIDA